MIKSRLLFLTGTKGLVGWSHGSGLKVHLYSPGYSLQLGLKASSIKKKRPSSSTSLHDRAHSAQNRELVVLPLQWRLPKLREVLPFFSPFRAGFTHLTYCKGISFHPLASLYLVLFLICIVSYDLEKLKFRVRMVRIILS